MKKFLILLVGISIFVAGALTMLFIYPFLFPLPEVNEKVNEQTIQKRIATAQFREEVKGQDAFHWAKGEIVVYLNKQGNYTLAFQDNFEAAPGPDYYVYLNSKKNLDHEDDFLNDTKRIKLHKLKSFSGSQLYEITAEQYQSLKSISIWCETFGQYIGNANLKP